MRGAEGRMLAMGEVTKAEKGLPGAHLIPEGGVPMGQHLEIGRRVKRMVKPSRVAVEKHVGCQVLPSMVAEISILKGRSAPVWSQLRMGLGRKVLGLGFGRDQCARPNQEAHWLSWLTGYCTNVNCC